MFSQFFLDLLVKKEVCVFPILFPDLFLKLLSEIQLVKKGLNFVICIQCKINKAKDYTFTLLAKKAQNQLFSCSMCYKLVQGFRVTCLVVQLVYKTWSYSSQAGFELRSLDPQAFMLPFELNLIVSIALPNFCLVGKFFFANLNFYRKSIKIVNVKPAKGNFNNRQFQLRMECYATPQEGQ